MNILVLTNLYPPNVVGGYERLCFDVTAALVARGHRATVLTSDFGGKTADYGGQTVIRELKLLVGDGIYAPFAGTDADRDALNRGNLRLLRRTLDQARPDVVFAWNLFFLDASVLDALAQNSVRTVVMLTDNWLLVMRNGEFVARFFRDHVFGAVPFVPPPHPPLPPPPPPPKPPGFLARLLGRTPPATGLSAIFGAAFVRDLYTAGGLTFPRHQVIHNGVRQAGYGAGAFRDRETLVDPGTLHLLFAGRLVDLKGADVAVGALPLLDPAALGVSRIVLTVLGDTQDAAYLAQLSQLIAASGRQADIVMQEPVAESALFDLFQRHDIYLFPSRYEPFSLTLIHALACGIPTVASRTGGNVEIVREGDSGLLFQSGDAADLARAVTDLATNPALRARVSAGGRAAAGRFTFERMVDEMERFLA